MLRLGGSGIDLGPLVGALQARGAPVEVHDIRDANVRALYDTDALLVRPDLHVAWRGSTAPRDPEALASKVTGNPTTKNEVLRG